LSIPTGRFHPDFCANERADSGIREQYLRRRRLTAIRFPTRYLFDAVANASRIALITSSGSSSWT
jgi:hypothetical protein